MSSVDGLVLRAEDHIQKVVANPETKLDVNLLELLSGENARLINQSQRRSLVNLIALFLQTAQQDPEPATKLAEALVESFTFTEVQEIDPPVDLVAGLRAPLPPVQTLTLRLIALASGSASEVAAVAGNIPLVRNLVEAWLCTENIAVAERAKDVLSSLLLADVASVSMPGLMQRRLFKDKDVYELFFSVPSLTTSASVGHLSKKGKTIAQGRLFSFLQQIWHVEDVWQSQISDVEQNFGLEPEQGLMHFASLHMVDNDDVLLRRTQLDFYADLVRDTDPVLWSRRSRTKGGTLDRTLASAKLIDFLEANKIHQKLVSLYAEPELGDPLDASFLHSAAAHYIVEYLLYFRDHFLANEASKRKIFERLLKSLSDTQGSQWARNDGPSDDLNVLVSVPYPALVSDPSSLLLLPTRPPSADVFRCLRQIFSGSNPGRVPPEVEFPPRDKEFDTSEAEAYDADKKIKEADSWASRQLYLRYTAAQPRFWSNIIAASSATALKDTAIAAIGLMTAIIRAQWLQTRPSYLGKPSESDYPEPLDAPSTGLAAVLEPSVLDLVVPFLMKGPSEGRGGAAGLLGADTESAEYHVAQAKLQMTRALKEGIESLVTGAGGAVNLTMEDKDRALLTELAAGLGVLLRQHAGRRNNEPGAEVGTMEL